MIISNVKINEYEPFRHVHVKDGKIVAIDNTLDKDEEVIDGMGQWLLPGLIDLNVCLKNDTLSDKNIKMLCSDAARGGVSTCVMMPNFTPRLDNETLLELLTQKLENQDINILVTAPLTTKSNDQLNNLGTLIKNGACAVQGYSSLNANIVRRSLQYAKMKDVPLLCNCYEPNLDDMGVMNEGEVSFKLGLPGISKVAEISEVAKMCEVAYANEAKVIFQSLSTTRSLELVALAKKRGANIMSEVSIHHLCKDDTECENFNTNAKIRPPLRDKNEQNSLKEMLKNGYVDILTSTHSPRSIVHKDVAFENASYGIHSISEFLSIAYTYLVKTNIISIEKLVELTSTNPAHVLGLENKGKIDVGMDADMVLFDEKATWSLNQENSIYNKEELRGKVNATFVKGKRVY